MYMPILKFARPLTLLALSIFATVNYAQTPTLDWANLNNNIGDNSDRFNAIAPLNGGYVAVGYTVKEGNYKDFLTVAMTATGDTLWVRSKNGTGNGNDEALLVVVDGANNTYVAGYSDGGNTSDDVYVLKYDPSGTLVWDTTWDNTTASMDDAPVDMALDASGNLLIAGNTEPDPLPGSSDIFTIKISPTGGIIWQAIYTRPGVIAGKDQVGGMVVDATGDAYVCGRSFNGTDDDFITMKFTGLNGTAAWATPAIYNGGNGDDRAADIAINAGNTFVYVTGRSGNGNDDDVRTIKYSNTGILQWTRFYGNANSQNDRGLLIRLDAAENVYVGGQTDADGSALTNYDFLCLKYNSAGTIQWNRTAGYAANQNDIPTSITIDALNRICMTGHSDQNPVATVTVDAIMTAAWSDAGTQLFTPAYFSGSLVGADNEGDCVIVDPITGNFIVAGYTENTTTQKDATVISYTISGTRNWVKQHNFYGDFTASYKKTIITPSQQSVSVGYAYVQGNERDALLKILDNAGNTLCSYLFNGSNDEDDEFVDVARDVLGNIYAIGYTKTTDQKSNYLLVKFNASLCDTVWTRQYNYVVSQSDKAESVALDPNGNIYITGRSDQNANDTTDNNDIVTIKYDPSGNLIWSQRYNGTGNLRDEPAKLLIDHTGHVVVCGRAENIQNDDIVVLKYDVSNGASFWTAPGFYQGPFSNDDRALGMDIDANDNIFVCGYSQTGQGTASDDGVVVKFSGVNGSISYSRNYDGNGSGNDQAEAIAVDLQGNVIVTYHSDSDSDPLIANYDMVTYKYSNDLTTESWNTPAVYNGPANGDDLPVALITDAQGGIYLTGKSEFSITPTSVNNDIVAVRYDNAGNRLWVVNYDGTAQGDDAPNAISLQGNLLWISGYAETNVHYQKDALVLKYDITTGLPEYFSSKGDGMLAYPNPVSNKSILNLSSREMIDGMVSVFSSTGALIFSDKFSNGFKQLNLSGWAPGLYQVKIMNNQLVYTNRIIVE